MNVEKQEQIRRDPALWGISEDFVNQANKRGEQLIYKKGKPLRREFSGGLWWLFRKGRVTPTQAEAGRQYGDCYQVAKGAIRSQLNITVATTGFSHDGTKCLSVFALQPLIVALSYEPALVSICNKVCGEGYRIRELARDTQTGIVNRTRARELEATLLKALDILATHFAHVGKSPLYMPDQMS